MNFRLRGPSQIRFSIAMLLVCVGACRPPAPGGGQASTSAPPAGRAVTSAPFAEGEGWILTSDTTTGQPGLAYFTMNGAGNLVSNIEVVTDVLTNDHCSIQSPDSASEGFNPASPSPYSIDFEFDGASMRVSASSQGDEFTPGCSVEFTASVARSGAEQALLGFNVFDVSIPGQALVSGKPVRFAPLQLNRVRTPRPIACEESPTSLVGLSWTISNVKPGTATVLPVPLSAEATGVGISGFDETISSVNLVGGGRAGCNGSAGTFSFDGTNLSFESSFAPFEPPPPDPNCNDTCEFAFDGQCDDGRESAATSTCPAGSDCTDCGPLAPQPPSPEEPQDGNGGSGQLPDVEPPQTCSVTFSGKIAECGIFLSPIVGLSGATEVLRIEGVGSFTDGENSGELTTVYLTIYRGGGACGQATIPTMAMIFFGLCGFRLISRGRLKT